MQNRPNLQINSERLWDTLMETAQIGGTAKGGIKRLTVTDLDKQVRDWFRDQCEALGCTVSVDEMGTMYAVRPGRNNDLPPVAVGSHLDTQPTGGKFDGVLGVLAGLEILRTLHDAGYETEAPVMVVNWTNEEGSRYAPAMLGSGVYSGAIDRDDAYGLADVDGLTFGAELERIGYKGAAKCGETTFGAFFELHIEQGPILEAEDKIIGVVTDGQGQRWYNCTVSGRESHAGTTPMKLRRDALVPAARIITRVEEIAGEHGPAAVGTVGVLTITEPSRNVIPGEVSFTAEFRHPSDAVLDSMDAALRAYGDDVQAGGKVAVSIEPIWHYKPVKFDDGCVASVRDATRHLGYAWRDIISGAGHDACYVSRTCPTSMVFIPCKDGISHNEIEDATQDHCAAGANVLLHAVLSRANQSA